MTGNEPLAELGLSKEQFIDDLLGVADKRIAEGERTLPRNACAILRRSSVVGVHLLDEFVEGHYCLRAHPAGGVL